MTISMDASSKDPEESLGITDAETGSIKKDEEMVSNETDDDEHSKKSSVPSPPESSPPSLKRLFQMAGPELFMLVVAIFLMIASEVTNLVLPLIVANAYDVLVDEALNSAERMTEINRFMGVALAIYAAGLVGGYLRAAILGVIGERMVARLRYKLFGSILKQEIAFFDEHKSGELVSRLGSDTTLLQQVISMSIPEALVGVIKTVVSIGLMFWISPKLAGVSIGSVFLIFIVAAPLGQLLGKFSKAYQDVLGEAQTYSTEAFGSMRTVQSFAAENKELNRFGKRIGDPDACPWWWPKQEKSTYRAGFFKALTTASFFVTIFGVGFGSLYICLWYGFYLVNEMEMTLGDLTAFQSYIFTIGFGLGAAASHIAKIFEGIGASGRVFYLLDRVPLIPEPVKDIDAPPPIEPEHIQGEIELRNVVFSYPSRPEVKVLDDFSLKIASNTTTALVGHSGSGKSTVVALLQRFYDVSSGGIFLDGNNITDVNLQWLRRHIGYVQQEPQLFGMSIRENLLYGVDREISQDELEKACRDANAHDFIVSWPEGYETLVGERGVKLSGGQKQRICIARALLTNCRILLLDEATSALDSESEHLVQEAINKAIVGRTVVIVAHRLSTIQRADQIVVMSNHKIVDVGTHEQLLNGCSKYQDLIKRQSMFVQDVSQLDHSVKAN
ncbi:efflux ABC transporter permease/ATP-binding protein [Nitzschia inconspicua]|uniref:Efflux ABC transporter permease/ATP-binding protein n=1 Tax=Nitzschia inconspicua TaxID=303405 RepID=A0A9K3LDZ2_9STRA|nr:efflux ABC transporter permease/ATP-binding protein [Nitzschia inconspicua]